MGNSTLNTIIAVGAAVYLGAPMLASAGAEAAAAGGWVSAEGGAGYLGGLAADASELASAAGALSSAAGSEASSAPAAVDAIGSDWAAGAATGPAGGMLPQTAEGLTAANAAAAPAVGPDTIGRGPSTTSLSRPDAPVSNTQDLAQQTLAGPDNVGSDWSAGNPAAMTGTEKFAPNSAGIIAKLMGWAGKHPIPATIAGTQVAGAVGGAGSALLNQSTAEKQIQAAKDLQSQRIQDQLILQAGTTAQTQANAYGGSVGFRPRAGVGGNPAVLYRANGEPVFMPGSGIINRVMRP